MAWKERSDPLDDTAVIARFAKAHADHYAPSPLEEIPTLEEIPLPPDLKHALAVENERRAAGKDAVIIGVIVGIICIAIFGWAFGGPIVGIPVLLIVAPLCILMGGYTRDNRKTLETEVTANTTLQRYTGPFTVERNDGEAILPYCWIRAGSITLDGNKEVYEATQELRHGVVDFSARGRTVVTVRDDAGTVRYQIPVPTSE